MSINSLTFNGIKQVVTSPNTPTILQVINLQPEQRIIQNGKSFVSEISDGHSKIKCYWEQFDKISEIGKNQFNGSIVKINSYVATNKTVMVRDFQFIYQLGDIIGNPVNYKDFAISQVPSKQSQTTQQSSVQISQNFNLNQANNSTNSRKPISPLTPSVNNQRVQVTDHSSYQLIQVLYAGFNHWILYCRINKAIFKDFTNQKNKQTKLLQFQIKDRLEWTIKCTIFGNQAQKMKEIIKPGQVFILSQGIIKLDTYKRPTHSKDSQFSITFTQHSKIQLAIDDGSISAAKDEIFKLQKIPQSPSGIQVDIIGVLKQIGPIKTFVIKNSNQQSSKRMIIICDPISKVECDVTLWRDQLNIDDNLLYKTVKLESFKTHEYQGRYSLTAWRKSKIVPVNNHTFQKFHNQINKMQFDSISFKKSNQSKKTNLNSVKQLLLQSQSLGESDTIWSTFRVYLNQIKLLGKKWYEACPNCRKAVSAEDSQCISCHKSFDVPVLRYVLSIELSDSLGTGSIWTTAHDDFSNKIFSYVRNLSATQASKMDDQEYSQFCNKCLFQEFKVTVTTKMQINPHDYTRRVKHQVNNFLPLDYSTQAQLNLEQIKTMCV